MRIVEREKKKRKKSSNPQNDPLESDSAGSEGFHAKVDRSGKRQGVGKGLEVDGGNERNR